MPTSSGTGRESEELVALAQRLRGAGRLSEATELLAVARRLAPDDRPVLRELAAVERERRGRGEPPRDPAELQREQLRRDAIDAAHFLGLAHAYAERGESAQALDCLGVAEAKTLAEPGPHKLAGRVLFRRRRYDEAAAQLTTALRLNPFDREVAALLGRVEFERGRRAAALAATVHAYLLVADSDEETAERLRHRLRTLKQVLGWDNRALARAFRSRQEELQVAFDRLQWRRERFLEEEGLLRSRDAVSAPAKRRPGGRIGLAARLRRLEVLTPLTDEQVFQLTRVVDETMVDAGAHVFHHRDPGRDLYLVGRGEVLIQRRTSYGTFSLGSLTAGELFGEAGYAAGGERTGDAVAASPCQLYRIDADALDDLLEERSELAVQLCWVFWRALAKKLRATNAQLQSFFDPGALPENFLRLRRPQQALSDAAKIESSDKIRLFREQGLSRRELMTLATFSRERRFPEGAYVFHEGDPGDALYVIAEGRVMICKYIAGGEEALAILDRGDFFGEMSLLDGEPRSADARAHGGPLTVLALDEATVRAVLSMDAAASLEFLRLLCRLLADRLREIDEKVIGWRILSGGQAESASA